jgi:SAM-dependent methyltransferase
MKNSCLLCKSTDNRTVSSLGRIEIQKLWVALNIPVEEIDLQRCNLSEKVELLECSECGFQFFDSNLAGDGLFYQKLAFRNDFYYNAIRPEFAKAIEHAKRKKYLSIIDLGCGSGKFLDLARDAGLKTTGMELNEQAAEVARSKGHDIIPGVLTEDFIAQNKLKYDMVTLFQVVEHLADPIGLLKLAKCLINDAGTLMFSVPNRCGQYQLYPLDPHQWPPHHISRWRIKDFEQVAKQVGMVHLKSSGDALHGRTFVDFYDRNNISKQALEKSLFPDYSKAFSLISFLYRITGMKHIIRNRGLSIYCFMEQYSK